MVGICWPVCFFFFYWFVFLDLFVCLFVWSGFGACATVPQRSATGNKQQATRNRQQQQRTLQHCNLHSIVAAINNSPDCTPFLWRHTHTHSNTLQCCNVASCKLQVGNDWHRQSLIYGRLVPGQDLAQTRPRVKDKLSGWPATLHPLATPLSVPPSWPSLAISASSSSGIHQQFPSRNPIADQITKKKKQNQN